MYYISCVFFGKTSNHPGDLADLVHCDFWLFPKLKPPLKAKRFQTIDEIQENIMGQFMAIGITVWCPKVSNLKGTETSLADADSGPQGPCVVDAMNKFTWTTEVLWRKRDGTATLWERESTLTLALTGFYWLSNSIHQRRFSFIMLGFALGDYFLQVTKERMLLITSHILSRKKCCKCKGMIRVIGVVTFHPWEN